jgi:3-dehydroquinate dehydratase
MSQKTLPVSLTQPLRVAAGNRDILGELTAMSATMSMAQSTTASSLTRLSSLEVASMSAITSAGIAVNSISQIAASAISSMTSSITGLAINVGGLSAAQSTMSDAAARVPSQISTAISVAHAAEDLETVSTWATMAPSVIIGFPDNFAASATGFSYFFTPDVANMSTYTPLVLNARNQYSCGGGAVPVTASATCPADAAYAFAQSNGAVHPGDSDMYVVVAYTIQSNGLYGLVNTILRGTNSCSRGVHFLITVQPPNNGARVTIIDQYNRVSLGNITAAPLLG